MSVSALLRMVQMALFAAPTDEDIGDLYPSLVPDTFAATAEHSSFSYRAHHRNNWAQTYPFSETSLSTPDDPLWQRRLSQSQAETTTNNNDDDSDDDDYEPNKLGIALGYIFLFFLIFGLSATVELRHLKRQLQNKFAIATGVAMQFVIMPILGFLAVIALKHQPGWTRPMGVALLVVTSSPGGSYSNWWCSLFNADLALSVAMTTVSSLLSMAMLPLNLFFYTFLAYGASEEESVVHALDFGTIFLALGIVLLAILSGLLAGYRWDNRHFHVLANRLGSLAGVLLVLFSIFLSSGADGAENSFWNQDWAFYVGVAFPCLVGISLANIIARSLRLAPPETVAISIECCYQNTGIATSVAIAMYDDKEERAQAVAVPLFYGVVEAVVIAIYCVWAWKVGWTKAPADERLCIVLTKTYEGLDDEDNDDLDSSNDDRSDDDNNRSLDRHLSQGRDRLDSEMTDLQSQVSSRFADETTLAGTTTVGSTEDTSPSDAAAGAKGGASAGAHQQQQPFWRRWFGGGAAAAGTTSAAAAAVARQRQSSTNHQKKQVPMLGVGEDALEPLDEDVFQEGSSSTFVASGMGTSATSSSKTKSTASQENKSSKSQDLSYAPQRDRSFTVETSASSGPPPTPVGQRNLHVIESGDDADDDGAPALQDLTLPDTDSKNAPSYTSRSSRTTDKKSASQIVSDLADVI